MPYSRLSRIETKKEKRRLTLAIIGILAIVGLLLIFGVKVLIGFSVFVENIRGTGPTPTPSASIVLPPTLNSSYEATNSATISLTGSAQPKMTLIVYLNNDQFSKQVVPDDGTFTIEDIPLREGVNTISAKTQNNKDTMSDLSNVVSISYIAKPPALNVDNPQDNTTVTGDPNTVTVSGSTDDNVTITINDRVVVVKSDNTFSYDFPLNDGDNVLTIVATDAAGNQTKIEKKVTYHH